MLAINVNGIELKSLLTCKPILCLLDYEETFFLRVDASVSGLGAVLLQDINGAKIPIAFANKKLLDRERNCSTIEKEYMAIVLAAGKLKTYRLG